MTTKTLSKPRKAPYESRCTELEVTLRRVQEERAASMNHCSELRDELSMLDDMTPRQMMARIKELEKEAADIDVAYAQKLEASEHTAFTLLDSAVAILSAIDAGKIVVDPFYSVEVTDLRKALQEARA